MHTTEFEYMWEDSVYPLIVKCNDQLDLKYKSAVSLNLRDLATYKQELGILYHRKREWLKKEYLPYDKKAMLDFHKLSAIMCRCIIGNKPFVFNQCAAEECLKKLHSLSGTERNSLDILRFEIDNIYINYKLAFLVGESIAFYDLVQWAQRQIDYLKKQKSSQKNSVMHLAYTRFIAELDLIGILGNYEWAEKHDPFYESMVTCLIKNDMLKRDFDYLLFAANMFQWQEYTKYKIFSEIIQQECYSDFPISVLMKGFNDTQEA